MKKLIALLLLSSGILLPLSGQTDREQPQLQLEQMQEEMRRLFENFNQQFDLEEGGMRLDTIFMKPFFFGVPEEGQGALPGDFSKQLGQMLEKMMQSFGEFPGDSFDSGGMEEWLKDLQERMPPEFLTPPPPGSDGKRKQKRKTYTL